MVLRLTFSLSNRMAWLVSLLTPALVTGAVKATRQPLTPAVDASGDNILAGLV